MNIERDDIETNIGFAPIAGNAMISLLPQTPPRPAFAAVSDGNYRMPEGSPLPLDKNSDRKTVVLLAEDNRVDVMLIKEAIEAYKLVIDLHVAIDGEQACEFIDAADADPGAPCPELLILDLNLPRKSGIEILERLRSSLKARDAAVLVVSSSDLSRERNDLARFGVRRHFRKPTGYEDYLKIGEVLDQLLKEVHAT